MSASSVAVSARWTAFRLLQRVERIGSLEDSAVDSSLSKLIDPRERSLAFELVYGVLRQRGTLDWRLNTVSKRPMERLPLPVATVLRLGAYQLLYLDRIPPSAAVNESVSLIKSLKGGEWSGYVNAVLRSLLREPAPPWPDSADDPVAALSIRYSSPQWLAQRWLERLGRERAEELCRAASAIPPLTIRANTLRVTRDALHERLTQAGVANHPTPISPVGLTLEPQGPITELPLFHEGWFYVEDEAAQLVPPLLDPQPGERILDACAAPGGKATQLAALMHNDGEIFAVDLKAERLRLLEDNCARLGVTIVKPVAMDAARLGDPKAAPSSLKLFERPFDRILVDAPCSGLGVLRRHPEGKWKKSSAQIERHQSRQLAILTETSRLLRPGGVIVYSTCSTEPDENERVIERFCADHLEFSRETVIPWLPPSGRNLVTAHGEFSSMVSITSMDGFFAARLRKAS
jgi:16S rRNA (cytosine967-C5)-methyltransferase